MADEFKEHLESFLMEILQHLTDDQELIEKVQANYDKLMDEFLKYNFVSKEQIDSIVDSSLTESEKQINELKKDKSTLSKQISELTEKNKILSLKNEEVAQKNTVLEKSFNQSAQELKKKDLLNQKIKDQQSDYDLLKSKYTAIQDEIAIYKKNLKKNYAMEKEISQLTQENEKLSQRIKELNTGINYKEKYEELLQINEKSDCENKLLNKQYTKAKQDIDTMKSEMEQMKSKLTEVENDKKLKNYQLEEKIKENIQIISEKEDILTKIKDVEYNIKTNKNFIDNQNREFKKELDRLRQENVILKKEKDFLSKELQKFKTYTNLAKVSRENMTKKDFSLMETMSRRVEESESLCENLKEMVQKLDETNQTIKQKNEKLENIILFYMKQQGELTDVDEVDEKLRADKMYQEVSDMKYDREVLLNMVFKLKQENMKINQQMQQITVEANSKIRSLTEQNKK